MEKLLPSLHQILSLNEKKESIHMFSHPSLIEQETSRICLEVGREAHKARPVIDCEGRFYCEFKKYFKELFFKLSLTSMRLIMILNTDWRSVEILLKQWNIIINSSDSDLRKKVERGWEWRLGTLDSLLGTAVIFNNHIIIILLNNHTDKICKLWMERWCFI